MPNTQTYTLEADVTASALETIIRDHVDQHALISVRSGRFATWSTTDYAAFRAVVQELEYRDINMATAVIR